jgi:hypothetical protein
LGLKGTISGFLPRGPPPLPLLTRRREILLAIKKPLQQLKTMDSFLFKE